MELTKCEMEIMDVLWDAEGPLSRADLLEHSEEKSWKDSSIHILLNGLLNKKAIVETGFVKRTKTYGRTFCPTMTREQYYAQLVFNYPKKPDAVGFVEALMTRSEITEETRMTLRQLLDRK